MGGTVTASSWAGPPRPPNPVRLAAVLAPDGLPLLRGVTHRGLAHVFAAGGRPTVADHGGGRGLTGPGSASWGVLGEPAAIAGGVRALLLQTLHPLAMAGVAQHSRYEDDPLGRLRRTSRYVTTATFGTALQAVEVTRTVRRVHRRVRGTAPDGRPYRADDPRLLVWVSCVLTSSFLTADRLWAPTPADPARADRFVAEQARLAALLDPRVDLEPFVRDPVARREFRAGRVDLPLLDDLPASVAALDDVLAGFEPELRVGEQALRAIAFLRRPPLPHGLLASYRALLAGAVGSLSPEHRASLGSTQGRVSALVGVARAAALITALRTSGGRSPAARAAARRTDGQPPSAPRSSLSDSSP